MCRWPKLSHLAMETYVVIPSLLQNEDDLYLAFETDLWKLNPPISRECTFLVRGLFAWELVQSL